MARFVPGTKQPFCTRHRILGADNYSATDMFELHTKYPREFNFFVSGDSFDIMKIDYRERVKNFE
jgi:hypothetical protein